VGQTAGRENGTTARVDEEGIYVPASRLAEALCAEPEDRLVLRQWEADWVEEELAGARVHDDLQASVRWRRTFAATGRLIPQACRGSLAKSKAAYRFFQRAVNMQRLLKGTWKRRRRGWAAPVAGRAGYEA
jgi:hypothetical protein